jgi:carboxylesterase
MRKLTVLGAAGAALVAGLVLRARTRRRIERAVLARLPVGTDGIVVGAGTIDLPGDPARGVLILHGFGDTPQTVAYLARHLHAAGWTVRAPLLPGHGRTLPEFARSRAEHWVAFARREYDDMRDRCGTVALVGLSMGGALAAVTAAKSPELPALVLLAPYVSMPTRLRNIASMFWAIDACVPYLSGRGGERSIHDPAERALSRAYGVVTGRLAFELARVVRCARHALPRITTPTLVIQSRHDNRIPEDAAHRAYGMLGAPVREMLWLDACGHVITVDHERERVFQAVEAWLTRHAGSGLRTADAETRGSEQPQMTQTTPGA